MGFLADKTAFSPLTTEILEESISFSCGNEDLDACKRAAMMYSLFGVCKVLGKNPERRLCYVLKYIDSTPEDKYYTLLPEFLEDEEQ